MTPVVTTTGGVAPVTVSATLDGAAWTSGTVISANGEHTLAVAVTDSAVPPTQLWETRHFTVDTEGPSLSIASPPPGAVVSTSPIVVTGTVSGAASLTLVGGQVVLQEGGVFSATVPLVEGTNPLRLVARDAAGNETSRDLPVVLDTLPPVVSLTSPSPGSCLAAGTTLTVAGRYIDAHPRPAGAPEACGQPHADAALRCGDADSGERRRDRGVHGLAPDSGGDRRERDPPRDRDRCPRKRLEGPLLAEARLGGSRGLDILGRSALPGLGDGPGATSGRDPDLRQS